MSDTPAEQPAQVPPQPAAPQPAAPEPAAAPFPPPPVGGWAQPAAGWAQPAAGYAQPAAGYPQPDPFMSAVRAPRTPWINPTRRVQVGAAALALALLFGGAGVVVGWAASDWHGHSGREFRVVPPGSYRGYYPVGPGYGRPIAPNGPNQPTPSSSS